MKDTVNILGTEYSITFKDDGKVCSEMQMPLGECGGYCNAFSKEIVIAILDTCTDSEKAKKNLIRINTRHEIIHAFLSESGLGDNAKGSNCWSKNEEMVDWIAIQFPKILKAFQEVGCL